MHFSRGAIHSWPEKLTFNLYVRRGEESLH